MKTSKTLYALALVALLLSLSACIKVCPANMTALSNWFESNAFIGIDEVTMEATFTNTTDTTLTFTAGATYQLWLKDLDDAQAVPVSVTAEPAAAVGPGENLIYNLTIDTSAFAKNFGALGFRGQCNELGNLTPDHISLVSVTFTCK